MTTEADSAFAAAVPPGDPAAPGVIVCERDGHWAVALRRELPRRGVRVHETRSLPECWDMLDARPASFLVAELTRTNATALLDRVARLPRDFPLARLAVVAARSLERWEWLMREAGAVHFAVSPRRLRPLARVASHHLEQVPKPQRTLTERIWASLPWRGSLRDER